MGQYSKSSPVCLIEFAFFSFTISSLQIASQNHSIILKIVKHGNCSSKPTSVNNWRNVGCSLNTEASPARSSTEKRSLTNPAFHKHLTQTNRMTKLRAIVERRGGKAKFNRKSHARYTYETLTDNLGSIAATRRAWDCDLSRLQY